MTAAAQMNCCFMWYGMNSICLPGKKNHETFYSSCAFHKKIKLKIQKNCVGHLSQGWDSIMFSTFLPITSHICRYVCFYVLTIFFCCCSLFISLESFTISKTYILVHGSIRLIMTVFFCIRMQSICPAVVYEQFDISCQWFCSPPTCIKCGAIAALLRLKVDSRWSKGTVSKESKKIIFGKRRPNRYPLCSEKAQSRPCSD